MEIYSRSSFVIFVTCFLLSSCLIRDESREELRNNYEVVGTHYVIGQDDERLLKRRSNISPSTVAIVNKDNGLVCTGTVISKYHVLTAAHCIYDRDSDSPKLGLSVVPFLHLADSYKPYSRFLIKEFFIPHKFIATRSNTYEGVGHDIAVLKVRTFQNATSFGYATVAIDPTSQESLIETKNIKVSMTSYTSEEGKEKLSQYQQRGCEVKGFLNQTDRVIKHTCDTSKGTSGSGLILNGKLIGINSAQVDDKLFNLGSALLDKDISDIRKIINSELDNLDIFKIYHVKETPYLGLDIKNDCDEKILVAVSYINVAGDRSTVGYYPVEAGQLRMLNIQMNDTKPYLYAISETGRFEWSGSDSLVIRDERRNFQKFQLPPAYQDGLHRFDCK